MLTIIKIEMLNPSSPASWAHGGARQAPACGAAGRVAAGGDGERGGRGRLRRERKLEFGHGFDSRDCMHES